MHRCLLALSLLAAACSAWSNHEQPAPQLPMIPLPWLDAPADASIAGHVRRDDDTAVPGARVCARHPAPQQLRQDDRAPRCVDTDQSGGFTISGLVPAAYFIQASAPGLLPAAPEDAVPVRAGQRRDDVRLTLAPGGALLRGEVVDIHGAPIAGAWVANAYSPDLETTQRGIGGRTDAQGRFSLWLAPGPQPLFASAAGHIATALRADAALDPPRIVLGPASTISGTVIDAVTRAPIAGARVVADPPESRWLGDELVDYTDAAGAFTLSRLPPGRYAVIAETGNRRGEAGRLVTVGLGEATSVPPLALASRPSVRGVVEACAGGRLVPKGIYSGGEAIGVDGEVFIPSLPPGQYEPAIRCYGTHEPAIRQTFSVVADPLTDQRWTVGSPAPRDDNRNFYFPHGELRGLVVDATGAPVPGARVGVDGDWLISDNLPTDASGHFAVHHAPPGEHIVGVLSPSSRDEPVSVDQPLTIVERGVHELSFTLPGAADPLRGRVVRDGAPVPGAVVLLVLERSERSNNPGGLVHPPPQHYWGSHDDLTVTDADGRFSFPRTYEDSRYSLWAYPLGGGDGHALDVLAGSDITLDIPRPAAVAGTLPGRPPQRFAVGVSDGAGGLRERRLFEHTDGRWGFDDLPPGTHDLLFVAPGLCATATLTVAAAERLDDVQPTVGELGGVRGRVIDGANSLAEPHVGVVVRATDPRLAALEDELGGHTAMTDGDGEFELLGLCPGAAEVTASTPLRVASSRAEISPRSVVTLSLVLRPTSDSD